MLTGSSENVNTGLIELRFFVSLLDQLDDAPDNSTIFELSLGFMDEFKINRITQTDSNSLPLSVAIGRFYSDLYDGSSGVSRGNPWFLTTATVGELVYKASTLFLLEGSITTDPLTHKFLTSPTPSGLGLSLPLNATFGKDSLEFKRIIRHMQAHGDKHLRRVKAHHQDGFRISEQFERETGVQKGMSDLTWSYASVLSAWFAREELKELTGDGNQDHEIDDPELGGFDTHKVTFGYSLNYRARTLHQRPLGASIPFIYKARMMTLIETVFPTNNLKEGPAFRKPLNKLFGLINRKPRRDLVASSNLTLVELNVQSDNNVALNPNDSAETRFISNPPASNAIDFKYTRTRNPLANKAVAVTFTNFQNKKPTPHKVKTNTRLATHWKGIKRATRRAMNLLGLKKSETTTEV
ncbi:glycoside hydrolase 15 protein, partial [Chytridiales sp. JEL 0842]